MSTNELIKSGVFGVIVGDALGVPVEFTSRAERNADPVTDMREYGTHNQPKGTWSDDSSMMLATMDSIINCKGIDYTDIMERFKSWRIEGEYTPHGRVFDIGITCSNAITNYIFGCTPLECGGDREHDNGNGSLMRIMPASLYVLMKNGMWETAINEAIEIVSNISSLTHRHIRSQLGCVLYTSICHDLICSESDPVEKPISKAYDIVRESYTKRMPDSIDELDKYESLDNIEMLKALPEDKIKSGGYVVDTLIAAVWCLLNSNSYSECVLKAVNLGDDTDTVGAVAGGLAGLYYGYENIPKAWLNVIIKKEWIEDLCEDFAGIL